MANKKTGLTALEIKFLEVKETRYDVSDVPGLFLRINPNGTKVWRINKSVKGQRLVKTLGYYPEITIVKARQLLETEVNSILNYEEERTLKNSYDEWIQTKQNTASKETINQTNSRFQRFILPFLGCKLWDEITPQIAIRILKSNSEIKPTVAKILCRELCALEVWAVNNGKAESPKLGSLPAAFPAHKTTHFATIHPDEVADALKILNTEIIAYRRTPYNCKIYFAILQATFYSLCRPIEVCSLRWDWIDFDKKVITLPEWVMKKRKEHLVPITPQLERVLKAIEPASEYVFLNDAKRTSIRSLKHGVSTLITARPQTKNMAHLFTFHGIRAIGRTWMSEHGVDFELAENCLAHTHGDATVQAYNRTTLLERRRGVMQNWCDFIEKQIKAGIQAEYFF